MEDTKDLFERRLRLLGDLIEGGAELAGLARQDAVDAPCPEARAEPSRRFHRLSQGVGRLIALEARLAGSADEALKAFRKRAAAQRRAEVEAQLQPRIRAEPDRQLALDHELWRLLCLEERRDGFIDEPTEALVARLARILDLAEEAPTPQPARPREGGDTPTARPREGGDPSDPSASPDPAWIPACAGMSGEGQDAAPPPHPCPGLHFDPEPPKHPWLVPLIGDGWTTGRDPDDEAVALARMFNSS